MGIGIGLGMDLRKHLITAAAVALTLPLGIVIGQVDLREASARDEIVVIEHASTDAVIDNGEEGDSAGDTLVFANDIYDADDANQDIGHYADLAKQQPFLGAVLVIGLGSLAGIPPLAGFVGKFAMFSEAMAVSSTQDSAGLVWLVGLGAIMSALPPVQRPTAPSGRPASCRPASGSPQLAAMIMSARPSPLTSPAAERWLV